VFHLTANNTLEFVGVHATDGNPVDLSFDAAGRLWLSTDQTTERLLSCLKLKTTAAASYKSLDAEAAPEQLFEFDADTQANLDSGVNVNGSIAVAGKPAFKYQYGELRKISIMRPGSGDSAAGAAGNDEDDDEYTTKAVRNIVKVVFYLFLFSLLIRSDWMHPKRPKQRQPPSGAAIAVSVSLPRSASERQRRRMVRSSLWLLFFLSFFLYVPIQTTHHAGN